MYKLRLKLLLKSYFNKDIISILYRINIEITEWLKYTFYLHDKKYLYLKLDLYIYKLFWRYLKKKYTKNSNKWIYLKYWGNFSGLWKFYVLDHSTNKFLFLKSHSSFANFHVVSSYKVYNSLNIFNLYNKRKLYQVLFMKLPFYYFPNYHTLYIKQKGLCFSCMRFLSFKNFKVLYVKVNKEKLFKNLVIVHSYCALIFLVYLEIYYSNYY